MISISDTRALSALASLGLALAACGAEPPAGGLTTSGGGGTASSSSSSSGTGGSVSSSSSSSGSTSSSSSSGSTGGAPPASFVYSPYKDTGINLNWNTNVLSTEVTGAPSPLLDVLPASLEVVTWAFATGECGAETWAGLGAAQIAAANVPAFVAAGKRYIISTGGAAGSFTCGSDAGFEAFLQTYDSASLLGVDFDIEAGQTEQEIDDLVVRAQNALKTRPNLRISFTVATLAPSPAGATVATSMGASAPDPLGAAGALVMKSIAAHGLSQYTINLMVMDYGSASPFICVVGTNGLCDMGQSALQAAMDLHDHYSLPYDHIELTPMLGMNDVTDEVFSLADADTVSAFAKQQGLAGVHFWSVDRDNDCQLTYASATCNSTGNGGTLGYTKRFLTALGL